MHTDFEGEQSKPVSKHLTLEQTVPTQFGGIRVISLVALCGALVFIAGCKGISFKGEKEAREQVQTESGTYRPNGQKPQLPVLTTNSSLAEFLTYALLNQPQVEIAYYNWLASVERITVQRSLPDPQLTFQM